MARCQCGAELTGRRKKCDACKARPGQVRKAPAKKAATGGKRPARPARKTAAKRAPAKKTAAKKSAPKASPPPADVVPAGLHDRGQHLWATLGQKLDSPAGQIALEACRAADRLDELDSIIAGKGVLNLMAFRLHFEGLVEDVVNSREDVTVNLSVDVKFQAVLAETRQQQANFKTLLAEISDIVPAAPKTPAQPSGPKKSPLDELAERRAHKK